MSIKFNFELPEIAKEYKRSAILLTGNPKNLKVNATRA